MSDPQPGPSGRSRVRRAASVLPAGTGTVGVWVGISGVLAYAFLAITGRALGAHQASGLSTLWVVGFLVGNATGLPVEQELSRAIASRRAQGIGVGPVIRRAAIASAGFSVAIVGLLFAFGRVLARELFGGSWVLLGALAVLFVATMLEYLVRGVLAGEGRFPAYGRLLGVEAASRVVAVLVLVAVGIDDPSAYAVVLALAPFAGIAAALVGGDGAVLRQHGPEAPWREISRALGWLLGASVLAQALVNLGAVFVRLLAPAGESALVSAFVASLIVARVPVFLFQAAQAALVPRLSHHAGGGHGSALAEETKALVVALLGLIAVATVGAALLGPAVVRIGWGDDFALGSTDMAILAAASCTYLLGVTFASALIALELPDRVTAGWAVGVLVFALCVAVGSDTLTRVEVGFLAGSAASGLAMGLLAWRPLARAGLEVVSTASVPDGEGHSR
ncbi:MAG: lipopolysaccharide biosynthesis protein [Acidimicrobiia bacterium]